jgi:hypothetical protein
MTRTPVNGTLSYSFGIDDRTRALVREMDRLTADFNSHGLLYGSAQTDVPYLGDPDDVPEDLLGKIAVFAFEGIRVRSREPESGAD